MLFRSERKAEEERQIAARRAAELAPDREKLAAYAAAVRALPRPEMSTEAGRAVRQKLDEQIGRLVTWIEKVSGAMG